MMFGLEAYQVTFHEIKEIDFILIIPRYVDTFEEEENIDNQSSTKKYFKA